MPRQSKKCKFVEFFRLCVDIIEYAQDEEDSSFNAALNYLQKNNMLKGDKHKSDMIDIIFMNIHKTMGVLKSDIETNRTHNDLNKYSKTFAYVLMKDVAKLSMYTIAQYFLLNRTTIKRYIDDFKDLGASDKKTNTELSYLKQFETIKKNVLKDINTFNESDLEAGSITEKEKVLEIVKMSQQDFVKSSEKKPKKVTKNEQ